MKIFDSHLHIIDSRFPLQSSDGYFPDVFTCEDYLRRMQDYQLVGGAIVSASFQGFDQNYLLEALRILGPSFVGVTQLPVAVSDEEIISLNKAGVRAIRFNFKRDQSLDVGQMEMMAVRVHELCGWHAEFYVDAAALDNLFGTLVNLPAISIDHLGLTRNGFRTLLKLVDKGARIKASGFGRVDFDVGNALQQIFSINPTSLMFGSDLPSTRAPRVFHDDDVNLIVETLGESSVENIFYNNAIEFYKPINLRSI